MTDVSSVLRLVDTALAARVSRAPLGYLLAHDSVDVARHCALLSTLPAADEVRVVATPGRRGSGEWHLDVAARDRVGLLAAFTGVLARRGIDVVQAVLATWDDGAALQAFVVRHDGPPPCAELQAAFAQALWQPLPAAPITGASVTFDHHASPTYTACQVTAPDQPGLLHAVAVALARAGLDVHAASVVTRGGMACDRFDLTDSKGRKVRLDRAVKFAETLRHDDHRDRRHH